MTTPAKKRRSKSTTASSSKLTQAPYELLHFLVCDEVRPEAETNKNIYIGVFGRTIILQQEGLPLDRLTFVFAFRETGRKRPKNISFGLEGQNGTVIPSSKLSASPRPGADSHTFFVQTRMIQLVPGEYTVILKVDSDSVFKGTFEVRVAAKQ